MNNKNKIVNLGYQLAIIIIELMFFYIKYLYIYIFFINYKNENNYGNNYNKILT